MRKAGIGSFAATIGVMAAVVVPVPVAAQSPPPAMQVVIEGRGWGHGVGMSQDGALAMGAAGAGTDEILEAFYPGTTVGHRSGTVDVTVFDAPQPAVTVSLPEGGEITDGVGGSGFPIAVDRGGSVRLSTDSGRFHAAPLEGATPAAQDEAVSPEGAPAPDTPTATTPTTLFLGLIPIAPAPTSAPPGPPPPPASAIASPHAEPTTDRALTILPNGGSSVVLPEQGRRYSGTLEAVADGGGLQLVNAVDVEKYLRGMGEVRDPGWPPAALRAQAIAARTYAMRAPAAGKTLCSTDHCQVYLGETVEYGAMNQAVADTEGEVLLYDGSLALSVYSASGGGISATPEEGFGTPDAQYPYLRAAPYPTQDPMPWNVIVPLSELAHRFGQSGEVAGARVSRAGPSGRPLEVMFEGPAGSVTVDARTFASTLNLRSNLFTVRVEGAPADPGVGLPSGAVTVAGFRGTPASAIVAATEPLGLGRPPWISLSLLLIVALSSVTVRLRSRGQLT
ncbi:MAG TPA: SpoIID/LytB domain-containing protein [Acidimicrobiales bacterium]|nr:SpoIID/LytB domain-containing protein [Acidimicrobiales bacterium]